MKRQLLITTLATPLLALASLGAQAIDGSAYIGASLGGTTAKDAPSASDLDAQNAADGFTTISSVDDTDTGWKLFGGYKFNRNIAIEAHYADLGKVTADSTVIASAAGTGTLTQTLEATSFGVAAVGILPLAYNFELFGKAGMHYWDADWEAQLNLTGLSGPVSESDNGTDLLYGVGAGYNFTKNFGLRAEWERYSNIGDDNSTGESDVDMWSAGIQYAF